MSRLKKFLEDLIFESSEAENANEKAEIQPPAPKPAPVRPQPVQPKLPETKTEAAAEKRSSSPVIDITAGEQQPQTIEARKATFINVSAVTKPAVKEEIIETAEQPKAAELKNEETKPAEQPRETGKPEYRRSVIISPIFGAQNVEEKPVKRRRATIAEEPKLATNTEQKESVIGTVLSPLYGDKEARMPLNDEIDSRVASMTVAEVIAPAKKEAKIEAKKNTAVKDERRLKDDTDIIEKEFEEVRKDYSSLKNSVTAWAKAEEKPVETRPDLTVTPFGASKEEVDDASPTKKLKFAAELEKKNSIIGEEELKEESEQLSLFDQ